MAELARQSSRYQEVLDYLSDKAQIGLPRADAETYTKGLVEQGFDSKQLFDGLTQLELCSDFGFKKGHAMRVDKFRKARAAAGAGGATEGDSEGDPTLIKMKVSALKKLATATGVTDAELEEADDADDVKATVRRPTFPHFSHFYRAFCSFLPHLWAGDRADRYAARGRRRHGRGRSGVARQRRCRVGAEPSESTDR
jgi:hypothetical protein